MGNGRVVELLKKPRRSGRPSPVTVFNRWRRLRRKYDSEVSLPHVRLAGANLKGINFERVYLYNAILDNANLEEANLRRAVFDYTNADGANFRNADLKNCFYLYKLTADGANFEGADLRGADLDEGYKSYLLRLLDNASFSRTKITPEQKAQLITKFDVREDFIDKKFLVMSLLGKEPHAWLARKSSAAYKAAEREGRIYSEEYEGERFEYALIPLEGHEDLRNSFGYAFSFSSTSRIMTNVFGSSAAMYHGQWIYFVFDIVPERFRRYAALHEFGERVCGEHIRAVKMEYDLAKKEGILREYLNWISGMFPQIIIGNALIADERGIVLPPEFIEAASAIMPKDVRAWKEQEKNERRALQPDIWDLAWRGLSSREIAQALTARGYGASLRRIRHYMEIMEIPSPDAIRKLTYLKPD